MKTPHFEKLHLIMVTAGLAGAMLGGLGATLPAGASGHWMEPALMLGGISAFLAYAAYDVMTRYRAGLPGARGTLRAMLLVVLAAPLLAWFNMALLAIIGGIFASLIVYIMGRADDNGVAPFLRRGRGFDDEAWGLDIGPFGAGNYLGGFKIDDDD
jgi:hypothetical protein